MERGVLSSSCTSSYVATCNIPATLPTKHCGADKPDSKEPVAEEFGFIPTEHPSPKHTLTGLHSL